MSSVALAICNLSSSLFLGGNFAQDLVYLPPMRSAILTPQLQAKLFDDFFERAKAFFLTCSVTTSLCHAYLYYITRNRLFLFATATSISMAPLTALWILPDVAQLKAMAEGKQDTGKLKEIYDRWQLKSAIRCYVVFATSYGILLYKSLF